MSLPQTKRTALVPNAELDKDAKLKRPERIWFSRIPTVLEMPRLIQTQIDSFEWFKREGLRELFDEISPIEDFTRKSMELHFLDY
ncbi:MAG: hypothetical protein J0I20_23485, partial [Chloroflexi bacterium]|nr:hypothetical protein [Chloroflexota bacterium]